jgi:hypothetical protein
MMVNIVIDPVFRPYFFISCGNSLNEIKKAARVVAAFPSTSVMSLYDDRHSVDFVLFKFGGLFAAA